MKTTKPEFIRKVQPGDRVTLQFNRNGEIYFIPIILEYDANEEKANSNNIRKV